MYVVTFYSYKGGVGRTMALVNVAVMLARLGRRVLVVDFDLEAPGLPSYQVFRGADCTRGVVDYVTSYRLTSATPLASDFITECDIGGAPIWLMPAGDHSSNRYSEHLQSIDWRDLYEHQEGYLMFEDLKMQWASYDGKGFDYVLIDSRTGHTDVGGICTRQLPDAVVVMFVPNEQNIAGLAPIVRNIRAEKKPRKKTITVLFCPSNVPDLDDEKGILKDLLADASKRLSYDEPAAVIRSYESLDVLTQTAFAISRPNSRLSKEYDQLKTAVISNNFDDYDGAIAALKKMPRTLDKARRHGESEVLETVRTNAIDIRTRHPSDGQISHLAAKVFDKIGDQTGEMEALTAAITAGHDMSRNLLSRAVLHLVSSDRQRAKDDLLQVITSPGATIFELVPALEIAQRIEGFWGEVVQKVLDRPGESFSTIYALSVFMTTRRDALLQIAEKMGRFAVSNELDENQRNRARNRQILNLIGSGEFDRALNVMAPHETPPSDKEDIDEHFNYAIARWGNNREVPVDLFEKLLQRFSTEKQRESPNWHQCFALALAAIGQYEQAIHELDAATANIKPGSMEFSCWTYLTRSSAELAGDIRDMREQIQRKAPIIPSFFHDVPITYRS